MYYLSIIFYFINIHININIIVDKGRRGRMLSVVPGYNNMLDFRTFILLHFVITLEASLDVEQAAACGSPGEEDGPPRTGNSIDSQGRLTRLRKASC